MATMKESINRPLILLKACLEKKFPTTRDEAKIHGREDRTLAEQKPVKPKKTLTPEMLEGIAQQQGVQRRVEYTQSRRLRKKKSNLPSTHDINTANTSRDRLLELRDLHHVEREKHEVNSQKWHHHQTQGSRFHSRAQNKGFDKSDDSLEDLIKAFERRDDYTLVDPREYYGALQSVSKKILKWVTSITKGMELGEIKESKIPTGATIKVRKLANDMYSGHLIDKSGNIDHLYDRLTIPALASQIMSVYEVYGEEPDEMELLSLKAEIERINSMIRSAATQENFSRSEVEKKLAGVIDKIDHLDKLSQELTKDVKIVMEHEENEVKKKLMALKEKIDSDIETQSETITARKTGEPGKCSDCGSDPCACYTHLTRPSIDVFPNGRVNIMFKSDWNNLDKTNFLHTMKMVVDRRIKKNAKILEFHPKTKYPGKTMSDPHEEAAAHHVAHARAQDFAGHRLKVSEKSQPRIDAHHEAAGKHHAAAEKHLKAAGIEHHYTSSHYDHKKEKNITTTQRSRFHTAHIRDPKKGWSKEPQERKSGPAAHIQVSYHIERRANQIQDHVTGADSHADPSSLFQGGKWQNKKGSLLQSYGPKRLEAKFTSHHHDSKLNKSCN